ncbi:MAG TPA: DUF5054 domain-containing protein, partial [Microthrixaceae bacterium]|nr:DUF5054 domain-containing protein [Microthrixaceae bacterium]
MVDSALVERVLVVSKTHLDVGFTGSAASVRNRYLEDFFPRAIAAAAELRSLGGVARLRWTTGAWILAEALEHGARVGDRSVELAIERGDLCWHALPFTLHTEYADRSLIEHGLSISARLDDRFGRTTQAAKMTDVPGHTRGLVTVLADAGVDFLHIGVNPASAAPDVPPLFRWRSPSGAEITVMYQADSYGSVTQLPGMSTVVAVDMTGDNLGPRSGAEVADRFADLSARFPSALIAAAGLDEVADTIRPIASQLPAVAAEIGDTWIHGVGSDPNKTARFRALSRQRRSWIESGFVDAADPTLARASTRLLLLAEHTWGLDQKTHWPVLDHWSASELAEIRSDESTVAFEASWSEQRGYLDEYVAILAEGGLSDAAAEAAGLLADPAGSRSEGTRLPVTLSTGPQPFSSDRPPSSVARVADGLTQVEDLLGWLQLGQLQVRSDETGAVSSLQSSISDPAGEAARELLGPDGTLAELSIQTFDDADYERWFSTYNGSTIEEDLWWARLDNTKPGLADSGAMSKMWKPSLTGAWLSDDGGVPTLVIESTFDRLLPSGDEAPMSAPARCVTTLRVPDDGKTVEFDLQWFDMPAARWPQAIWWRFAPLVDDPAEWTMVKLGEEVSPLDVVSGGARHLHCVERLIHPSGVALDPLDSGLVAPGGPQLLRWNDSQPDMSQGWSMCLYNNVWGTNFPMWTEGNA